MDKEPEIKFVKDLKYCARAICLYWIGEIHIDDELKNHPALQDIIAHEKKHYEIICKALNSNPLKQRFLMFWNNIWDFLSTFKISIKYFRMDFIRDILIVSGMISFILIWVRLFWGLLHG